MFVKSLLKCCRCVSYAQLIVSSGLSGINDIFVRTVSSFNKARFSQFRVQQFVDEFGENRTLLKEETVPTKMLFMPLRTLIKS